MKKLLAVLTAAIMAASMMTGCGDSKTADAANKLEEIKSEGKIVMGTSPDFAPSEFEDTSSGKKEIVGSDIELAKYIAQELGVELEIKPMEFMAIQQALVSNVVDMGIAGFAATPKRAETLGLSDPYGTSKDGHQGLVVMKGQGLEHSTAESFSGMKIGAQNASLQQDLCNAQLPEDIELKPVGSIPDAIMMLTTGKLDAVALALDNADSLIATYPEIEAAEFKFEYQSTGNVVAVNKEETELLEEINKIIASVNEQGLYEQWKEDAVKLAKSLNIEVEE